MNYITPGKHRRLNIAVIGTGIAGMSAAWLLNKGHRITVYEKNDRIGGHSNTVDASVDQVKTPVDTGFIVYNELNYPNLTALFKHLDVPTKASEMSFAASLGDGDFEYADELFTQYKGNNTSQVQAQKEQKQVVKNKELVRHSRASLFSPKCSNRHVGRPK